MYTLLVMVFLSASLGYNISINKSMQMVTYSFNQNKERKQNNVEIKCFLERKECIFSFWITKPKGEWVYIEKIHTYERKC